MSTFIINLNDTVALNDSTLIELVKVANSCQSCVQEAATNYDDVRIVAIICAAIVIVALIAWGIICSIKCKENEDKNNERASKKAKEEEDYRKKQYSDLVEKLLNFHQKRCDYYCVDKDGKRIDKDKNPIVQDDAAVKTYVETIDRYIKEFQKPNEGKNEKPMV